jgi:hypothetical protein
MDIKSYRVNGKRQDTLMDKIDIANRVIQSKKNLLLLVIVNKILRKEFNRLPKKDELNLN